MFVENKDSQPVHEYVEAAVISSRKLIVEVSLSPELTEIVSYPHAMFTVSCYEKRSLNVL